LVPKEKKSASFAISSAVRAPRGTSIMVPTRNSTPDGLSPSTSFRLLDHDLLLALQLLHRAHQRIMTSGLTAIPFFETWSAASKMAPRLHAGDLGIGEAQAAAAVAEHGV
jgi:hypothetical protein